MGKIMHASDISPGCKVNRFTIIKFSHRDKRHRKWWDAVCECGTYKTVHGSALVSGNTKSCGCLSREIKANTRISDNHSEVTAIILGYKRHAIGRGFKWLLSRESVKEIIKDNCYYCGCEPSNKKLTKNSLNGGLLYSGIDRIDSSKDYVDWNCVSACKICNYAKSNMDIEGFKTWAIRIGSMADQWT